MVFIVGLIFRNRIAEDRPQVDHIYQSYFQLTYYFIQAQGSMFICAACAILSGIFSVALVFPSEREIYFK